MAERTVARMHPHRVVLLGYYIAAFVFLAVSLAFFFYPEILYFHAPMYLWLNYRYVSLSAGAAGLAILLLAEVAISTHRYVITNARIIKRKGLLTVWEDDILFDEISRCSIKRSVFDRMFGDTGTVFVKLKDGGESCLLEHVENAGKVKGTIDRIAGRVK